MGNEGIVVGVLLVAFLLFRKKDEETTPPQQNEHLLDVIRKGEAEHGQFAADVAISTVEIAEALKNPPKNTVIIETDTQRIIRQTEEAMKAKKEAEKQGNKKRREGRRTMYQRARTALSAGIDRMRITIRNVSTSAINRIRAISSMPSTGTAFRNVGLFGAIFGLVDLVLDKTNTWEKLDGRKNPPQESGELDLDGLIAWEQDMRHWGWAECYKCNCLFRDDEDAEYVCPAGGVHSNEFSKIYGVWRKPENIPDSLKLDFIAFNNVEMCLNCGQLIDRRAENICFTGEDGKQSKHRFGNIQPFSLCGAGHDGDTVDYDQMGACVKCNSMVLTGTTHTIDFPPSDFKLGFKVNLPIAQTSSRNPSAETTCFAGGRHIVNPESRFLVVAYNEEKTATYPFRRSQELAKRIDRCAERISRQRTDVLHWVNKITYDSNTRNERERMLTQIGIDNVTDKKNIVDYGEEMLAWGYISPNSEKALYVSKGLFNFNRPENSPVSENDSIWIHPDRVDREMPNAVTASTEFGLAREQFLARPKDTVYWYLLRPSVENAVFTPEEKAERDRKTQEVTDENTRIRLRAEELLRNPSLAIGQEKVVQASSQLPFGGRSFGTYMRPDGSLVMYN